MKQTPCEKIFCNLFKCKLDAEVRLCVKTAEPNSISKELGTGYCNEHHRYVKEVGGNERR
jgi:hypothetical protein